MTPRLSFTFLSILGVAILPWWGSGLLLLLLVFIFPWYYEALLIALIYDLLYGSANLWLTIAIVVALPFIEWFKKRLYVFT